MGFKDALTKMGLIEEEVQVSKPTVTQNINITVPVRQTLPIVETAVDVAADPAIVSMLSQSLQDNKLSGFDYLKFVSAVEEMKGLGTPEDARFKMAGFTAKQLGVDKAALLKSGEHYLDVLKQDENEFNANCAQHNKNEIQGRQEKLAQIESTITSLSKQLAQLQQDHETVKRELQTEISRLESKKVAFQLTLKNFRTTIESNIQKINQYLA